MLKDLLEVRLYLQPLQGSNRGALSQSASGHGKRGREAAEDEGEVARMRRRIANLEGQLRNQGGSSSSHGSGGAKAGKGKGKRKGNFVKMPAELLGMELAGPDGSGRCLAFYLGTCSAVKPGERCPRGWHVCMRPGCGKPHSQRDH